MLVLLAVVFNSPTLSILRFLCDWSSNGRLGQCIGQSASFLPLTLFFTRNGEYVYGFEWIVASRLIYVIGLYHAVQKSGTVVVS